MRECLIVGNWKMNTTIPEAVTLAHEVSSQADALESVTAVICPPFVAISEVSKAIADSPIEVGAQNLFPQRSGAFTGEVAAEMLRYYAKFVIVGHSERRTLFGETNQDVAQKAVAATRASLRPILCVGEPSEIRTKRTHEDFVRGQLRESLAEFNAWDMLILAYEPIWAIGSGQSAQPLQVGSMGSAIRAELTNLCGPTADHIPILYGGSVTSVNVGPFLDRADIDGALVGGASLVATEFAKILSVASTVKQTESE